MRKIILALVLFHVALSYFSFSLAVSRSRVSIENKKLLDSIGELGGTMCARKSGVAFELGCKWVPMPVSGILSYCDSLNVDWLFLGNTEIASRQEMRDMLSKRDFGDYEPAASIGNVLVLHRKTQ